MMKRLLTALLAAALLVVSAACVCAETEEIAMTWQDTGFKLVSMMKEPDSNSGFDISGDCFPLVVRFTEKNDETFLVEIINEASEAFVLVTADGTEHPLNNARANGIRLLPEGVRGVYLDLFFRLEGMDETALEGMRLIVTGTEQSIELPVEYYQEQEA